MLATDTASADVKFFFGVRRERTSLEIAAQEPSESTPRELAAFVRARPLASPTACVGSCGCSLVPQPSRVLSLVEPDGARFWAPPLEKSLEGRSLPQAHVSLAEYTVRL